MSFTSRGASHGGGERALTALLRYRSTFDHLLQDLRPPRRARTVLRTRPGDAWLKWHSETSDNQEEHEVAEALFDLANMFKSSSNVAGTLHMPAGTRKSKRHRIELKLEVDHQLEEGGGEAPPRRPKRIATVRSGRHREGDGEYRQLLSPKHQQQMQPPRTQQEASRAAMSAFGDLPQGSLQATACQMQRQRDEQAYHAAQQTAQYDLVSQLASNPQAAALADAMKQSPAAAARALTGKGGPLDGLQPGFPSPYFSAMQIGAAAAALQHNGWGNPGDIEGFSNLTHAEQDQFAKSQLQATAQTFAAEQMAAELPQHQQQEQLSLQQQAATTAARPHQLPAVNGTVPAVNGTVLAMNGIGGRDVKQGTVNDVTRFPRSASHVYIAHFIHHQNELREQETNAVNGGVGKQEGRMAGCNGSRLGAEPRSATDGTPPAQLPTRDALQSFLWHSPGAANGCGSGFPPDASGSRGSSSGGSGGGSRSQYANDDAARDPLVMGGSSQGFVAVGAPFGERLPHDAVPSADGTAAAAHHDGLQGGRYSSLLNHMLGGQGGFGGPMTIAQQQRWAAQQEHMAHMLQGSILGGAQTSQPFGSAAAGQVQGMHAMGFGPPAALASSHALQGGQPFLGQMQSGQGGYSVGAPVPASVASQIAGSGGLQMDSKLLAEMQQMSAQQTRGQQSQQLDEGGRFDGNRFPGILPPHLTQGGPDQWMSHLNRQQQQARGQPIQQLHYGRPVEQQLQQARGQQRQHHQPGTPHGFHQSVPPPVSQQQARGQQFADYHEHPLQPTQQPPPLAVLQTKMNSMWQQQQQQGRGQQQQPVAQLGSSHLNHQRIMPPDRQNQQVSAHDLSHHRRAEHGGVHPQLQVADQQQARDQQHHTDLRNSSPIEGSDGFERTQQGVQVLMPSSSQLHNRLPSSSAAARSISVVPTSSEEGCHEAIPLLPLRHPPAPPDIIPVIKSSTSPPRANSSNPSESPSAAAILPQQNGYPSDTPRAADESSQLHQARDHHHHHHHKQQQQVGQLTGRDLSPSPVIHPAPSSLSAALDPGMALEGRDSALPATSSSTPIPAGVPAS